MIQNNQYLILAILFFIVGCLSEYTRKSGKLNIKVIISGISIILCVFFIYKYIKEKQNEKKKQA